MRCSRARSTSAGTRIPRTSALDHRVGGETRILGMRDVDADWATVLVMRKGRGVGRRSARSPGGALALGSRDSGHAAILPLHYLAEQGLDAERECELLRFDTDLGKHGDTGDSELRVVRAVAAGEADAGALSDAYFSAFRAEGVPDVADSRSSGAARPTTTATSPRSPRSTGLGGAVGASADGDGLRRPGATAGDGARGRRRAGCRADREGYASLAAAMQAQGLRAWCRVRAHRIDAERLELGGGLEVLLAAALERVPAGGSSRSGRRRAAVALELPGWARVGRARAWSASATRQGRWRVHVRRGAGRARARRAAARAPHGVRRCARRRAAHRATGAPARRRPRTPSRRRASRRSARSPRRARPATAGRWVTATRCGPTTSASSSSRRPRSSGTPPATSHGRPRRACPTTSSAPSPRS